MEATKELNAAAEFNAEAALLDEALALRELSTMELSLVGGGSICADFR